MLGAVISPDVQHFAFYSHKMTVPQTQYTVREEELICIVKTSKSFCTNLLSQQLKTLTNHKNLTCKNVNTNCILGRRLIREECITEIEYIQGEKNIVPDKISQFPDNGHQDTTHESTYTTETMSELHEIK